MSLTTKTLKWKESVVEYGLNPKEWTFKVFPVSENRHVAKLTHRQEPMIQLNGTFDVLKKKGQWAIEWKSLRMNPIF